MFITLEGPEGSGKTSQVKPLADFLRQQGFDILTTREPGGTSIGEQVRTVLMRMDNQELNPRAEILLFCAARVQLVEEVIRPNLDKGVTVICDRYADSTLAYQGFGQKYDVVFLRQLLNFATGGLWPDLTLLLDIDSEQGLSRKNKCQGEWNRMDALSLAFHQRVRQGYLELARQEPQRWQLIDASQPWEMVQSSLRAAILARLSK